MTANQLERHAEKIEKNGVTIIGNVGAFILSNRVHEFISYEQFISTKATNAMISIICCYHKKDFTRLSEEQRQKILAAHTNSFIINYINAKMRLNSL